MIIESHLLSKRFRKAEAVSGVSLRVPEGSVTALVGANGAGKTTLMRLLVNLLPPDSGEARVLGVATAALGAADFARLGYVSEGQLLPNGLTVEQYFDYLRALYPKWDRKREDEVRRAFDLPPTRKLGQLSRGMQMKARIAGVLPYRPALLVLDEPLSGLDPLARDEVLEGLLANAEETTILLSSHELTEIEGCATHLAFMDQGRLLVDDSVEELSGRFRDVTAGFVNDPTAGKAAGELAIAHVERADAAFHMLVVCE